MSEQLLPGFHGILGPMWASKTTRLISCVNKHRVAGHLTVLLSPREDTRNNQEFKLTTHDKIEASAVRFTNLDDITQVLMKLLIVPEKSKQEQPYIAIGLDEGQFIPFLETLFLFIEQKFDMRRTFVYVSALNGSFQRKMFKPITDVYGMFTSVISVTAVCGRCSYLVAPYTHRKVEGDEEYLPGGEGEYMSVCGDCWVALSSK